MKTEREKKKEEEQIQFANEVIKSQESQECI